MFNQFYGSKMLLSLLFISVYFSFYHRMASCIMKNLVPLRVICKAQSTFSSCKSRFLSTENKVALVFGAGEATGAACTKAFALEGYTVIAVRRNKGATLGNIEDLEVRINNQLLNELRNNAKVYGYSVDARNEKEVESLIDDVENKFGPIHIALHNIGPNMPQPFLSTSVQRYQKLFEISATSSLIVGKECAKRMIARGTEGCIFFTGATACLRGNANFSAFASAMSAKRMLAQSMAKELGPQGIHVAHVIVDGIIDTPFHQTKASPVPRDVYSEKSKNNGLIKAKNIANAFVYLSKQPKDAWTFEMDLRPWNEKW